MCVWLQIQGSRVWSRRVPYFHRDWSWNNFCGHSPPFRWFIQKVLLSVTSESICIKYWLNTCSSLPRKKSVVRWTDRRDMTIAVYCSKTNKTKLQKTENHHGLKPFRILIATRMIQISAAHLKYRTLVKSAQQKNNFLISQPKHILWVLKRTISMRWFFWAPKTYARNYG